MTPAERLIDRLRAMGVPVPEGTVPRRTYAGWAQRSQGAWSWFLDYPAAVPGLPYIGSHWPLRDLLHRRLMVTLSDSGAWEIDPWAELSPQQARYLRFEEKPR